MTVFLPLATDAPLPSTPSFLLGSSNPRAQISRVIQSVLKAKRMVVICGAGISVHAGIPDFRSTEGLFKTLKRDNPREALTSGKDLFDASVFNSDHTTALFCQMIAKLWGMSQAANPTAFHTALRALDNRGKLLRVYTQNIDAIEQKCGLSFGVPDLDMRCRGRSKNFIATSEPIEPINEPSLSDTAKGSWEPPRCIPLHGTLQTLHCQICQHSYPVERHLPSLSAGLPPHCPDCTSMEETRQLVGKRARGVGRLRPSIVLYNEAHKDGEGVGGIVQRDLLGSSKGKGRSGADLLLVVGTSLRVPGTKRMVREFSKAIRSRASAGTSVLSGTPCSTPSRSFISDEESNIKTIYLNLDFPIPTREWEGVFDVWIQGDAQDFAQMLQEAMEKETKAKELAGERKRKREQDICSHQANMLKTPPGTPQEKQQTTGKLSSLTPASKKRKIVPPTTVSKLSTSISPSQKLFLRIPARSQRSHLVPEVYISTTSKRPKAQQPPTPENSPLARCSLSTRAGRRAARAASRPKPLISKQSHSLSDSPLTSDNDIDLSEADLLPNSFVRTIQHGLRDSCG